MGSLKLTTASSGSVILSPANTASDVTITVPATTATMATVDGSGNMSVTGNLSFNSGYGSSAVAYGCRAWVNFNGTGTVSIRASGNVSSISDYGTGNYGVNFSTAMPNANYSATAGYFLTTDTPQVLQVREYFTTYCTLIISQPGIANYDSAYVSLAVHR